jgi:hypothetical protein
MLAVNITMRTPFFTDVLCNLMAGSRAQGLWFNNKLLEMTNRFVQVAGVLVDAHPPAATRSGRCFISGGI